MRKEILFLIAILTIFLAVLILSSCNITGNAVKEGTPEFDAALNARIEECNQKGMSLVGSKCFQEVAFEFNRPALCSLAGTYKNHCIVFVAAKTKNPELCPLAGKMENICLHSLGIETPNEDE